MQIIDYERFNKSASYIFEGTAYVDALSLEEGAGIIKGGQRNVEATLLLAGNAGTDKEEQRKYQENLLRIYGMDTEIWFQQELFNLENYLSEGSGAKVHYSPNIGFIRKERASLP